LKVRTREEVFELRFDPEIAIEIGVAFTEDNARALGKGWTEGDLYIAHFLGIGSATKVLRAAGSTPVSQCVSKAAVAANRSILLDKTCAQVRAWAQNSMDTRWAKLGNPDWIGIWYHKDDSLPVPSVETVNKNAGVVAIKVEGPDGHLVDINGNGIPDYLERVPFSIPHGEFAPVPPSQIPPDEPQRSPPVVVAPPRRPSAVVVAGAQTTVQGDPDMWLAGNVLKSMHYNPGKVEGQWGGMFAEAIAGFVNDRHVDINVPRSSVEFNEVVADLLDALARAQDDHFVRPVSQERANADDAKVKEVAPESAPAKRGFWITVWGAITSFGTALYKSVEGYVGDAWTFFTDNDDKIPDDVKDPNKIWAFVTNLPVGVWFVIIGGILAFVALGNWRVFAKIREDVQTGMRK
jgi:hypothetical protein